MDAPIKENVVPRSDIPPLIPGLQGFILNGSNAFPDITPIPDAIVSASASARDATKPIKKA